MAHWGRATHLLHAGGGRRPDPPPRLHRVRPRSRQSGCLLYRSGNTRRLGGPPLRWRTAPRLLHRAGPPQGLLSVGVLRSRRTYPPGPRGQHRAGPGCLPSIRPHPPSLQPAGDDGAGRAARPGRHGQPLASPGGDLRRAGHGRARSRPAAGGRDQPQFAPHPLPSPALLQHVPTRPCRRGGGSRRRALRAGPGGAR